MILVLSGKFSHTSNIRYNYDTRMTVRTQTDRKHRPLVYVSSYLQGKPGWGTLRNYYDAREYLASMSAALRKMQEKQTPGTRLVDVL